MIKKKIAFLPPIVFLSLWFLIVFLFELRLSTRLSAPTSSILYLVLIFGGGFCVGSVISLIFAGKFFKKVAINFSEAQRKSCYYLLYILTALSLLEVAIEGFVPAVAMASGRDISHFDFGISSVHGLIIAGYSAVGTIFFVIYCTTGDKVARNIALIPILYAIVFVSRKMFTVCFIQYILIFFFLKKVQPSMILRGLLVIVAFIFAFGAFGDLRGRTSTIEAYGGLSTSFDFVGDTGFQWVYLYLTTPLENLSYTTRYHASEENTYFTRTFSPIVPSAIKNAFSGETSNLSRFQAAAAERYWLQSSVFNVSTGFNPAYLDKGMGGIFFYSSFIGFCCSLSYLLHRGVVGVALFGALMAGSLLTVFSNSFANLNYVGQVFFFLAVRYPLVLRTRKSLATSSI